MRFASALLVIVLMALFARAGNELALHEEHSEAVVTLIDQDRKDTSLYRWVLVVGLDGSWSTLLNRESGQVLQCVGRARTREITYLDGVPRLRLGECVTVWAGVVQPKKGK